MIVQPTPTNPRTRRLRARHVVGLVVPPALLGLVVLAGFAGPRASVAPPRDAAQPSALAGSASSPTASTSPTTAFPAQFGDLPAIQPSEDVDQSGLLPSDAIAVTGYLGVDPAQSGCFDQAGGPFGPWCDRRGILAATPWATSGTAPFPPHLRVHIPVGVRLPSSIENVTTGSPAPQVPVLVVGRKSVRPAACQGFGPVVCDDELEIDRVAWARGVRVGLTPLVDSRLQTSRRPNPFTTALDTADLPLLGVLVWPEDVWRLDSEAGAVALQGVPGQPVWYLRVVDGARAAGVGRSVRWMLLAEPDLHVLAAGRPGEPITASIDGG